MSAPFIQTSFAAGELAPSLWGHVDFNKFHVGLSTCRNAFISYRGGALSRAGTAFAGYSKQTGRAYPPRLVTFQFSNEQGFALEFGNLYMRVIAAGDFVTEASKGISGATQASPCVLTVVGHGYATGDWDFISGVGGMTQLNGQTYVIAVIDADHFSLSDVFGAPIDSSAFGAYSGGGAAARLFTLATPWAEQDLAWLKFTQSADVMSLCCWNQETGTSYPAYDLARLADDNWTLTQLSTGAAITAPATMSGTATVTTGMNPTDYQYVVTAIDAATGNESVASPIADIPNSVNISATAGSEVLSWSAVAGAAYYHIYKAQAAFASTVPAGALFGYAGTFYGTQAVDTNITADFTQVPPLHKNPFLPGQISFVTVTSPGAAITSITAAFNSATGAGATGFPVVVGGQLTAFVMTNPGGGYQPGDTITFVCNGGATVPTATLSVGPQTGTYPSVVAYFQERRVYAATPNQPDTYFMSQPGAFKNFDSRVPTISSDAIVGTPWSVQVNGIQYMVSMPGGLVALTGLSAWQLTGAGGSSLNPQPITPSSQQAQPQAYNGCRGNVPPIKIDANILYVQAKGSILRNLEYNYWINIYTGTDVTLLSSQLFTGFSIREMAWCEEPYKVLWAVRDDGVLLSYTFLKSQEVSAWARHDTNGLFQSVCAVTEPPVDALYLAVQRFLQQGNPYLIERMDDRLWSSVEDVWAVDSGLSLPQFTPAATLSATSPTGSGIISAIIDLVGGAGYSAATTVTVKDPTGTGAAFTPTIAGGIITGITIDSGGLGYTNPQIIITDPAQTGTGASASVTLDNRAFFTATAPVFLFGIEGSVIRMGGGIAIITHVVTNSIVTANIISPITAVVPNGGGIKLPIPAAAGTWTVTAPVTTIGGLGHLASRTVTGLADGQVITPRLVASDGTITLDAPASAVTVGLGYQVQLQSLYLDVGQPTIQGRRKKIAAATLRLEASRGVTAGTNQPDGSAQSPARIEETWTNMQPVADLGTPPFGSSVTPLYTGDARVQTGGGFGKPGQVAVQQDYPLPLNLLAIVPEALPGDEPQLQPSPRPERRPAA